MNPVWIAINMLLRARGLRLGANATTAQLNLAETFFDVQAAIDAAAICNQQVTALVGAGSETQFKFRGTLQEEKPLRDWLQEVLMNCLGYYTFSFGKLKIGVRENSSTVEAFTIGNIVFNSSSWLRSSPRSTTSPPTSRTRTTSSSTTRSPSTTSTAPRCWAARRVRCS